jgi:hypothetical protein
LERLDVWGLLDDFDESHGVVAGSSLLEDGIVVRLAGWVASACSRVVVPPSHISVAEESFGQRPVEESASPRALFGHSHDVRASVEDVFIDRFESECRRSDSRLGVHAVDDTLESCADAQEVLHGLQFEARSAVADVNVQRAAVVNNYATFLAVTGCGLLRSE